MPEYHLYAEPKLGDGGRALAEAERYLDKADSFTALNWPEAINHVLTAYRHRLRDGQQIVITKRGHAGIPARARIVTVRIKPPEPPEPVYELENTTPMPEGEGIGRLR